MATAKSRITRKPAPAKKAAARAPTRSGARASGKAAATDWRLETLGHVRRLIVEADPDIIEERKWVKASSPLGVPVWSHVGIVCTGETYKAVVKLTFARGASLNDPRGLFNASLGGSTRRAIDIREGERLNARALKDLIRAAVALNLPGQVNATRSGE